MTRTSMTTATHPIGRINAHNRSPISLALAGSPNATGQRDNSSGYAGNTGWGYGGMTYHGWGYGG